MAMFISRTVLVVVTHLGFLVSERVAGWLNGLFSNLHVLVLERRLSRSAVNGVLVDADVLGDLRAEALAVLTFSNVDGA